MSDSAQVLVIGGGMVGATAALSLAHKGFSILLVDKNALQPLVFDPAQAYALRISAISPASRNLLARLGIWPVLRGQRLCDYPRMRVWHQHGSARLEFDAARLGLDNLGSIVENHLVQAALIDQLRALPNVQVVDQARVEALEQDEAEVRVRLADRRWLKAELLLAADGRQSDVANLVQASRVAADYAQSAIVANVTTELPHQATAWQRFLDTGPLAFLPLANGQSSIVWSADEGRAQELMDLGDEAFLQELSDAFEYRLGRVISTSSRQSYPLGWHYIEKWLHRRVLFIGDAAHGVHPLAGQGANLGFADVALLSELIQAGQPVYRYSVLRRFERQRKAEAITALHLFSALKLVYGQSRPWITSVRDIGMRLVNDIPSVKRRVMRSALSNMG